MDINFKVDLDFKEQKIQDFIYAESKNEEDKFLEILPKIPDNFYIDVNSYREKKSVYQNTINFLVREEYAVFQNKQNIGSNFFTTIYGQNIDVSVRAYLILKSDVTNEVKLQAENLVSQYNFTTDGDLYLWIKSKLTDVLKEDMFIIDTSILIEKIGKRITIDDKQVQSFLTAYTDKNAYPKKSIIDIVTNANDKRTTLADWAEDMKITFSKIGEQLLTNEEHPKETKEIQTLPLGVKADDKALGLINDILSTIIPTECGVMKPQQQRLLTLYGWFEIKVEWRQAIIENDCFKIVINYPVFLSRESRMVLYIYYATPENVGNTLLDIVIVCAKRAALAGGVLGLVLGNPAAAIVVFKTLFGRCVEEEIVKCSNPGILTLKEIVNDWH